MSVACGVEWVLALGFLRWGWKRCTYIGSYDSATWPPATAEEFEAVPRICRVTLAVYEGDLRHPQFPPAGGYRLNPDCVIKRLTYEQTHGNAPPYIIYLDHDHREIVLAIRGLNLIKESDYKLLLDNKLGMQMFDGGYVHHGLLKSAVWLLNEESDTLKRLWLENGASYKMIFAGHSLGSGVAALLTVIVDDFLPRTPTPLEDIFKSLLCLPCLLFAVCWRDTFIPEGRKLKDPRRLYAPGRMYHIVERKFCRCGRYPPEVRTAIPVDGRFEHIVLSCNATKDHAIVWIEREAEKALERMPEYHKETTTAAPRVQKIERLQTIEKEHKDALERAVSLNIPHAVTADEEEEQPSPSKEEECVEGGDGDDTESSTNEPKTKSLSRGGRTNWDLVVQKLFKKYPLGEMLLKKDDTVVELNHKS
ncbi:uncharacterized protein LOC114259469 [Camellia sinensis]|uniref:uncharacterized protein LOC114259469 n=1 Tax=Camellia sinensis TaxID=4442 RepID=UPI001036A7BD|nr:uncharacterized protein LOC114259469 [Camellia sinensis]